MEPREGFAVHPNKASRSTFWTVVILAGTLLYGASIGPACWLTAHENASVERIGALYKPWLWLDSVAPEAVREGASSYVGMWGVRQTLDQARRTVQTWRTYPVGDLTYRVAQGQRHFQVDVWFTDLITNTILPETWDEVGGIGRIVIDPARESMRVLQSREGHIAVADHLRELRARKEALGIDGGDLDLQKLYRALFGYWFLKQDLLPETVFVKEESGGEFVVAGKTFDDMDGLIRFLDGIPVEMLKSGICRHSCDEAHSGVIEALTAFCEARNIDLFTCYGCCYNFGVCFETANWIVRAQESPYLDSNDGLDSGRGSHPFRLLIPWRQGDSTPSSSAIVGSRASPPTDPVSAN